MRYKKGQLVVYYDDLSEKDRFVLYIIKSIVKRGKDSAWKYDVNCRLVKNNTARYYYNEDNTVFTNSIYDERVSYLKIITNRNKDRLMVELL